MRHKSWFCLHFLAVCICIICITVQGFVTPQARRKPTGVKKPPITNASSPHVAAVRVTVQDAIDSYLRGDYPGALRKWRSLAEQGNAFAQSWVARMYSSGEGTKLDQSEAAKWYRAAAEQGDILAMSVLGSLYITGSGVTKDEKESERWRKASETSLAAPKVTRENEEAASFFRAAALRGSPVAQDLLGDFYTEGRGVPKDYLQAADWYRKAAEQGNTDGQIGLGWLYKNGNGVTRDPAEAARWYRKAAETGRGEAYGALAEMYATGDGVTMDLAEAERFCLKHVEWLRTLQAEGRIRADSEVDLSLNLFYYNVAERFLKGSGLPKSAGDAAKWYRKAADRGYGLGALALGDLYYKGEGVPRDVGAAAMWYRRAADKGLAWAQNKLGELYYKGEGVPRDLDEAERWWRRAADQGRPSLEFRSGMYTSLGETYFEGNGVPQDYKQAEALFLKGMERGEEGAARMLLELGAAYLDGKGGSKDYEHAERLFLKGVEHGDRGAAEKLQSMYSVPCNDYYKGNQVIKNYSEAAKWCRKDAEFGGISGMSLLSQMYIDGKGVPKDYVQAYMWANLGAATETKARELRETAPLREANAQLRDALAAMMTSEQVAQAQEMSRNFKPKKLEAGTRVVPSPSSSASSSGTSTRPSDEADAESAITRIRRGQHSPMPETERMPVPGANPGVVIENQTDYSVQIYLVGPATRTLTVSPRSSATVNLPSGLYSEAAEVVNSNVIPFYGTHYQEQNAQYRIRFYLTRR